VTYRVAQTVTEHLERTCDLPGCGKSLVLGKQAALQPHQVAEISKWVVTATVKQGDEPELLQPASHYCSADYAAKQLGSAAPNSVMPAAACVICKLG
jgi:hypothetical protein